jgi:hypothetical protein
MIQVKNFVFKTPNWRPKVLVTDKAIPEIGIKILREKCDVTICGEGEGHGRNLLDHS